MKKPSMFSSNYEQQLRQRRINITLIILIIALASFFGVRYYCNKHNIVLFNLKSKPKVVENKKDELKTNNDKVDKANTEKKVETPKELYYEYKTAGEEVYKIIYTVENGVKSIKDIKDSNAEVEFDISPDKQYILFEDKWSKGIVLGDINGNFKAVDMKSYRSKSAGITIEKASIIEKNSWYIWAAKPHFTKDGRIVFISHLPYLMQGYSLHLWIGNMDGTWYKMAGKLTTDDINKVDYEGIQSDGSLKINSDGTIMYLAPNAVTLSK